MCFVQAKKILTKRPSALSKCLKRIMWISDKIERRSTDTSWSCRKLNPPNIPWSHSIQERRLPSVFPSWSIFDKKVATSTHAVTEAM